MTEAHDAAVLAEELLHVALRIACACELVELQGYVNEYVWRWNNREDDDNPGFVMFRALLESAAKS